MINGILYCFKYDTEDKKIWREECEYTYTEDPDTICVECGEDVTSVDEEEENIGTIILTIEEIRNNDCTRYKKVDGHQALLFFSFSDDMRNALEVFCIIGERGANHVKDLYFQYKEIYDYFLKSAEGVKELLGLYYRKRAKDNE